MSELLDCVEIDPAGDVRCSVIWLHGLGADGHDFEPIVPHLGLPDSLGVRFVFPHAPLRPVTVNMGMTMRAWYDIRGLDLRRDQDLEGIQESARQTRALIDRENERGVPNGRIVLAGFSQGGAVALHVGLRLDPRPAGLLALSTYLLLPESLEAEHAGRGSELPLFQGHGTLDPLVPIDRGEAARDALREVGYEIDWHSYPMQHEVCPQEIADVGAWLGRTLTAVTTP
ncbi:MAG: alpha/beta fold hydrolase [bacterium]|nr:alpha/beta fold hydrolase [bacterium]